MYQQFAPKHLLKPDDFQHYLQQTNFDTNSSEHLNLSNQKLYAFPL